MSSCTRQLDEFLAGLDVRIRSEIAAVPAAQPALPLVAAGGKRLRARLLWLTAATVAPRISRPMALDLERAAAAIELAHLGSLVHDDIVDGAETRRNVPTLHRTHGTAAAVRTGSALLHLASALIAPLPQPLRIAVGRAVIATCRGQVRELMGLFQICTRRERYAIMRDKTGAFFELAAELGATIANGSPQSRLTLRRFSRFLGLAFQVADDVLDLVGDPLELGRTNGSDLQSGVVTLPIVLAVEEKPALHSEIIRRPSSIGELNALLRAVVGSGGIERAVRENERLRLLATRSLTSLANPTPRRMLLEFLADRGRCRPASIRPSIPLTPPFGPPQPERALLHEEIARFIGLRGPNDLDGCVAHQLSLIDPRLGEVATRCSLPTVPWDLTGLHSGWAPLDIIGFGEEIFLSHLGDFPTLTLAIGDCLAAVALTHLAKGLSRDHLAAEVWALEHLSSRLPPYSDHAPVRAYVA
jgi:heptaprenyl diphosphate synthase